MTLHHIVACKFMMPKYLYIVEELPDAYAWVRRP